jgi:hypothetical protein
MKAASACALLACAGQFAAAQPACPPGEWPTRIELVYEVTASRGPLTIDGTGALRFERNGAAYSLSSEVEAVGLYRARQSSRGTIDAGGLKPAEYVEVRGGRPPRSVRFDWVNKRVEFSAAPDSPAVTRAGMQDRASLVLQLAWRQRANPDAAAYEIDVAGVRRVATFRFERGGEATLQMPAGTIDAVMWRRPGDEDSDRVEVWYAPRWCGLPVRIRYTDRRGGTIDHRLRTARIE